MMSDHQLSRHSLVLSFLLDELSEKMLSTLVTICRTETCRVTSANDHRTSKAAAAATRATESPTRVTKRGKARRSGDSANAKVHPIMNDTIASRTNAHMTRTVGNTITSAMRLNRIRPTSANAEIPARCNERSPVLALNTGDSGFGHWG